MVSSTRINEGALRTIAASSAASLPIKSRPFRPVYDLAGGIDLLRGAEFIVAARTHLGKTVPGHERLA